MTVLTPAIRRKVLLITLEPVSARMAGPAIRAVEMGKALASDSDVTVFSPRGQAGELDASVHDCIKVVTGGKKQDLQKLAQAQDILVIQANVLKPYPFLSDLGKYLVVDLYDPYLFMIHIQYQHEKTAADASYRMMHQVLEKHMLAADFAICASERQRDYWIGRFCALGRIDTRMYDMDSSLRKLIDVVPFGLSSKPAERNGPGLREALNFPADDPVLLWGGGIWDWFDPLTIIKAVSQLSNYFPRLRMVFMGTKSPNPQVEEMAMVKSARELSSSLGLLGKNIYFVDEWIPYEKRVNYLLEADVAVSAHFDLPETRFSFRTRILDYIWCNLPIITTCGDSFADLIDQQKIGLTVPYNNVDAWVIAISTLLTNQAIREECRKNVAQLSEQFTWEKSVAPLREYCLNPHHLPSHTTIRMPSILERAKSVYARGGKNMVMKRSSELIKDFLG